MTLAMLMQRCYSVSLNDNARRLTMNLINQRLLWVVAAAVVVLVIVYAAS